jgi:hypothetical protein
MFARPFLKEMIQWVQACPLVFEIFSFWRRAFLLRNFDTSILRCHNVEHCDNNVEKCEQKLHVSLLWTVKQAHFAEIVRIADVDIKPHVEPLRTHWGRHEIATDLEKRTSAQE